MRTKNIGSQGREGTLMMYVMTYIHDLFKDSNYQTIKKGILTISVN